MKVGIVIAIFLLIIVLCTFALNRTYAIENYCINHNGLKTNKSTMELLPATEVEKNQAPALVGNGMILRRSRAILHCEREQKNFYLF